MALHVYAAGEVLTASNLNTSVNPLAAIKTATETVNNNNTPQDDDELFITPQTNSSYLVQLLLIYKSTSQTPDFRIGFSFPVGANFTWSPVGITPLNANQDTSNQAGYIRVTSTTSTATRDLGTIGGAENLTAAPVGLLAMGSTAGSFRLQWSQGAATAENTQLLAGSVLVATKIA